jgi:hypothetical protein
MKSAGVNARERVRLAIRQRLADLGMTGRTFGKTFSANDGQGHVDQWVSNLLTGKFALSLDELDEAARILKTTAATLVKSDFETAEYLTPTEHRILEAVRGLPPPIRDHVRTLAEYLVGVAPEEIDHLMKFRELTPGEREKIDHWTDALRLAREPVPGLAILPDHQQIDAPRSASGNRTRDRQKKKP